jgi:hypothetical protein
MGVARRRALLLTKAVAQRRVPGPDPARASERKRGQSPSQPRASTARPSRKENARPIRSPRRFDRVFFTVCAFVGLDTLGTVAPTAGRGSPVVLGVVFGAPYALLIAELGDVAARTASLASRVGSDALRETSAVPGCRGIEAKRRSPNDSGYGPRSRSRVIAVGVPPLRSGSSAA